MNQKIKINNIERLIINNSNIETTIGLETSNIVLRNGGGSPFILTDDNEILSKFDTTNFSNISNKISIKSFSYSNLADRPLENGIKESGILKYVPGDRNDKLTRNTGEWKIVSDDVPSKSEFTYELTADSTTETIATYSLDLSNTFYTKNNIFNANVYMSIKDTIASNTQKYCFATVYKNGIVTNNNNNIVTSIIWSNSNTEWTLTESDDNKKLKITVSGLTSVTSDKPKLILNIR